MQRTLAFHIHAGGGFITLYTQMLYVFGFSFPFRTPHLGETLYGIE